MREIIFRGKTIEDDQWVYGDIVRLFSGETAAIRYYDQQKGWKARRVYHKSVGQYIGVKDVMGCKIFEGDVVSIRLGAPDLLGRLKVSPPEDTFRAVVLYNEEKARFEYLFGMNESCGRHIVSSEIGWYDETTLVLGKFFDEPFDLERDRIPRII